MNILYVCADRGIPIRGHKGASVHVRALTDAMAAAGHAVTILTLRPGPDDGPSPRATLVACPLPPADEATPAALDRQARAGADRLTALALAWLKTHPCDLIYERYSLWSDAGARLRAATGLPLALEVNAPLRQEAAAYRTLSDPELAAAIETRQFAAADFLAVVSQPLADYVVAHGAAPERVHVLPNAVDPALFHPAVDGRHVRRRYGLDGRIVVGFAGRMRPWHDGPTLLRAFARLHAADPAYHLLLVGELPAEMTDAIRRAGLAEAVTCTGPIPHAEVPAHLAAMDVAVCSHAAEVADDGFYFSPLKLFEYLACAVPTVAAAVGQPAELIQPGHNGELYPPGDDAALAAAIARLVADPVRARRMAWNGATLVLRSHTWAQNAARVLDWLAGRRNGSTALRPSPNGHGSVATTANGVGSQSALSAVAPHRPTSLPEAVVPLPILDDRLRQTLYRATRPDLAQAALTPALSALGLDAAHAPPRIAAISVLKYKPGRRCVLAYTVETDQADGQRQQRLVGKVFRDERGRRLYALYALLRQHGFGADAADGIVVPRPLAYVPDLQMFLQEHVPGRRVDELSLSTSLVEVMPRCAAALTKLHRCRLPAAEGGVKPYTLADEVGRLGEFTAKVGQVRPDALPAVKALQLALEAWAADLPPAPAVPALLHRDFYYSQVLLDGPTLALIDLDLLALGDPALDVANFAAHLAYLGLEQFGDPFSFAAAETAFLAAYTVAQAPDPTFAQRVTFYRAATLFRLLSVVITRPHVCHLFEPLLALTQASVPAVVPLPSL